MLGPSQCRRCMPTKKGRVWEEGGGRKDYDHVVNKLVVIVGYRVRSSFGRFGMLKKKNF